MPQKNFCQANGNLTDLTASEQDDYKNKCQKGRKQGFLIHKVEFCRLRIGF